VTIEGATCSRTHIGKVDSRAGDAAQGSPGELFLAFHDLGIECSVTRFAVSSTAPEPACELNLPLLLGPELISNLRRASGMAAGLDFTVASASLGALLRISEKSLGGMPEVELLGVEVDLSPRHLSLSLRNLPLPGADLLASSAVGALLGTWGVASSLDVLGVGGTLASIVSQAVTQMIATEVRAARMKGARPGEVAPFGSLLAGSSRCRDGDLLPSTSEPASLTPSLPRSSYRSSWSARTSFSPRWPTLTR